MDAEHRFNNLGDFIFVSDLGAAKAAHSQSPFPKACLCPGCGRQGAQVTDLGWPQGAALDGFLVAPFSIWIPGFRVNLSFLGGKCSQLGPGSAEWLRSCLPLCDPRDRSPPGSPDRGVCQARIAAWVAITSSRGTG